MPGPALTFPMQLPPQVRREFEAFLAQLNEGYLYVEHKEDGTHGDITADSIIVNGTDAATFGGPIDAAHWLNLDPVLDQHETATELAGEVGWTGPRILLGFTGEQSTADFARSLGLRLRGEKTTASGDDDWAILVGQDGNSAATAIGVQFMDDVGLDDRMPLIIRYRGGTFEIVPGKVTEGTAGVSLGSALGGYGSGYLPFSEIHGRTITAGTDINIGGDAGIDVKLRKDAASVLGIVAGDASSYVGVNALYFFGTNQMLSGDGLSNAPSFTFAADQDTGFYRATVDTIGVSVGALGGFFFLPVGGGSGYGFTINPGPFGTGSITGGRVLIGRNTSGSGCAGHIGLQQLTGGYEFIWADGSALLRISNSPPREDGSPADTSGVVVGDQTSSRAAKHIIAERFDYDTSLAYVLHAPVFDFTYRDGRYNGEMFTGITTDDSPVFGKDGGKALNEVSCIGHLMQAIKAQQAHIESLERRLTALEKRVE